MKKQISLVAIVALFISFVAFSGVASAQTSNVQVVFFTSPMCSVCQQVHPLAQNAAAKFGVPLIVYDVSTATGKAVAQANGVTATPTIIVSGAKTARFEGSTTQAQIETAIQQAIPPKPTPTAKPTLKAATTKPTVKAATTKPTVKAAKVTQTTAAKTNMQPAIEVVSTPTPTSSTQTVPEFSLLGLGAPTVLIGAIYLFLRRR
jgi:thioredoxin-like negative regulator of GroEL